MSSLNIGLYLNSYFSFYSNCLVKNGDGTPNQNELNLQTIEDYRLHKLDLKMAEREIFGRQLVQADWQDMNDKEKQIRSLKILEIVKRRMEKRYIENGKF